LNHISVCAYKDCCHESVASRSCRQRAVRTGFCSLLNQDFDSHRTLHAVEDDRSCTNLSADTRSVFALYWELSREVEWVVDGCKGGSKVSQTRVGKRFVATPPNDENTSMIFRTYPLKDLELVRS
jgi:hypothetical protein